MPIFSHSICKTTNLQFVLASVLLVVGTFVGCAVPIAKTVLPTGSILERDQLVFHSDFYIPSKHRLIDELVVKRVDIADQLKIPLSDEPINFFVFKNEADYRRYLSEKHPEFPDRRAFFVKTDTTMRIYAFWGEQIGEDLRHEVTHGYLHSVIPNLDLWLDEGIAEYYEVARGNKGINKEHVYLLNESFRRGDWEPNLESLELITDPAALSQLSYAESWLWIHFLLAQEERRKVLQDQLARLRMSAESEPLSKFIDKSIAEKNAKLVEHLKLLAEQL